MCGCEPDKGITCPAHADVDAIMRLLAPASDVLRVEEIVRQGGGSAFKVTDGDHQLIFSTADEPNPATVVTMRIPDFGVVNFTLSHRESVHLMAHLSDVTG